jgi:hypothetical protein
MQLWGMVGQRQDDRVKESRSVKIKKLKKIC